MSEIEAFTRYVGLVVLLFALVLVAPRVTATAWSSLRRGLRPLPDEEPVVPVLVREGVTLEPTARHLRHLRGPEPDEDVEVLDTSAPLPGPALRAAFRRGLRLVSGALESRAVLLVLCGLFLRYFGEILAVLPEPAVLAGDLALVLVTFLVMRKVLYTYVPAERVGSALEGVGAQVARAHAPFDQILRLVLLSAAVVVLVTWPSQVGWQLAQRTFGAEVTQAGPVVAFAFQLPWLLLLTWAFVREQRLHETRS